MASLAHNYSSRPTSAKSRSRKQVNNVRKHAKKSWLAKTMNTLDFLRKIIILIILLFGNYRQ
ncbi:MAG: hypothetical protein ACK5XF_04525 [Neisseriaceae bacterium]